MKNIRIGEDMSEDGYLKFQIGPEAICMIVQPSKNSQSGCLEYTSHCRPKKFLYPELEKLALYLESLSLDNDAKRIKIKKAYDADITIVIFNNITDRLLVDVKQQSFEAKVGTELYQIFEQLCVAIKQEPMAIIN